MFTYILEKILRGYLYEIFNKFYLKSQGIIILYNIFGGRIP